MTSPVLSDGAFLTGQRHFLQALPGQDYALAGQSQGLAWGVVSDGCSSSGHTDVGARLWAHAGAAVLQRHGLGIVPEVSRFAQLALQEASPLLERFAYDDGFATLGLVASDGRRAGAALFGDGVLMALQRDGTLVFWGLSYAQSLPRYLNYERQARALSMWEKAVGPDCLRVVRNEYRLDSGARDADGSTMPELLNVRQVSVDGTRVPGFTVMFDDLSNLQALFVCTDGATSSPGANSNANLLALAGLEPGDEGFLKRHLSGMQRRWQQNPALAPEDDMGVAAVWVL